MPILHPSSAAPWRASAADMSLTCALLPQPDLAQTATNSAHTLNRVTVTGSRPSTLPLEIPTTLISITGAQIQQTVNAVDFEDALKYFPSLDVRNRYPGDYDHAVLATRASGAGNSARSLVFSDSVLLSNLLSIGASYTPRWGMVTPDEIERVDVLYGAWAQDAWRINPLWKAVLGARADSWRAYNGSTADNSANSAQPSAQRSEVHVQPKAALSFAATPEWTLKASTGRAVRMPTVAELYQGAISANVVVNNDSNLKPEKSWTTEWTAERAFDAGSTSGTLCATLFHERESDALYSQTNVSVTPNVTNIQNLDAMRTTGLELALQLEDVATKGLDINSSLTFADSKITRNNKSPASVGMWQQRVPQWRPHLLTPYKPSDIWSVTGGLRYSDNYYGTLDNTNPNGAPTRA